MGLNAEIYVLGDWTEEQVAAAEALFENRLPDFLVDGEIARWGDTLDIGGLDRYYGPGYERGPWPTLYAAFRLAKRCFPDATVIYSSDASTPEDYAGDSGTTEAELQEIWDHWLGPNGDAYFERNRSWNAARGL